MNNYTYVSDYLIQPTLDQIVSKFLTKAKNLIIIFPAEITIYPLLLKFIDFLKFIGFQFFSLFLTSIQIYLFIRENATLILKLLSMDALLR